MNKNNNIVILFLCSLIFITACNNTDTDTTIEPTVHKVTFNLNDADTTTATGEKTKTVVVQGDNVNKPKTPVRPGYRFGGWVEKKTIKTTRTATNEEEVLVFDYNKPVFDFNTKIEGDVELVAQWIPESYTVTFEENIPQGASAEVQNKPEDVVVLSMNLLEEPKVKPLLNGFLFKGWYTDKETKNVFSFPASVTKSQSLYPKWIPAVERVDITSGDIAYIADSLPLTAKVEGGETNKVIWSIPSNTEVASFIDGFSILEGSILFVGPGVEINSKVTVRATSEDDENVFVEKEFTAQSRHVRSVKITSKGPFTCGGGYLLVAEVVGGSSDDVTWRLKSEAEGVKIERDILKLSLETRARYIEVEATSVDNDVDGNPVVATQGIIIKNPPVYKIYIEEEGVVTIGEELSLTVIVKGGVDKSSLLLLKKPYEGVTLKGALLETNKNAKPGVVVVVATSIEDRTVYIEKEITLEAVPDANIVIVNEGDVTIGEDVTLSATVNGVADSSLLWTLKNPYEGVSIEGSILKTKGASPGVITLIATSTEDDTKFASQELTLVPVPVTNIVIEDKGNITIGEDFTLSAVVTGGTDKSVLWTLKNPYEDVSIEGSILKTIGASPGTITLIATSVQDDSKFAEKEMTLILAPVTNIVIEDKGNITIGEDYTLSAVVTGGTDKSVLWTLKNPYEGVSIEGGVLKTNGASPGTITLIATSVEDESKFAEKEMTLVLSIHDIVIEDKGDVKVGEDYTLSEMVQSGVDVSLVRRILLWRLKTPVAGVSIKDDVLKTSIDVHPGEITVVVTSREKSGFNKEIKINLQAGPVSYIVIQDKGNISIGEDFVLSARVVGGKDKSLLWNLKTPVEGVSIEGSVLKTSADVQPGEIIVVATSVENEEVSQELQMNIVKPSLIQITTKGPAMIGEVYNLKATIKGEDNPEIAWSIKNIPMGVGMSDDIGSEIELHVDGDIPLPDSIIVVATSIRDETLFIEQEIALLAHDVTAIRITNGNDPFYAGTKRFLYGTVTGGISGSKTWSLKSPVEGITINNSTMTIEYYVKPGTKVTFVGTSSEDESISAEKEITIRKNIKPTTIVIVYNKRVELGVDYNLKAVVYGGEEKTVTWSLKEPVQGARIEGNILKTDPRVPFPTSLSVVATSTVLSTVFGEKEFFVNNLPASELIIDVNGPYTVGDTVDLSATMIGGILGTVLKWSLVTPVEGIRIVDNNVLFSDATAAPSDVTIKVSHPYEKNVEAQKTIRFNMLPVESVSINKPGGIVEVGTDRVFSATVVGGYSQEVVWSIRGFNTGLSFEGNVLKSTPDTVFEKTYEIVATSKEDSSVSSAAVSILYYKAKDIVKRTVEEVGDAGIFLVDEGDSPFPIIFTGALAGFPGVGFDKIRWEIKTPYEGVSFGLDGKSISSLDVQRTTKSGTLIMNVFHVEHLNTIFEIPLTIVNIRDENFVTEVKITNTGHIHNAKIGEDIHFEAEVIGGPPMGVTWEASYFDINNNRLIDTLPAGVSMEGNVLKTIGGVTPYPIHITVVAKSRYYGGIDKKRVTNYRRITFTSPSVYNVEVLHNPTTKVTVGTTYKLNAKVSGGKDQSVTWALGSELEGVTIEGDVLTASLDMTAGMVDVVAISNENPNVLGRTQIEIIYRPVEKVVYTPNPDIVIPGVPYQLNGKVIGGDKRQNPVIWWLSPELKAKGAYVTSDNKLILPANQHYHSTTYIKLRSTEDKTKEIKDIKLKVKLYPVVDFRIDVPKTITIKEWKEKKYLTLNASVTRGTTTAGNKVYTGYPHTVWTLEDADEHKENYLHQTGDALYYDYVNAQYDKGEVKAKTIVLHASPVDSDIVRTVTIELVD